MNSRKREVSNYAQVEQKRLDRKRGTRNTHKKLLIVCEDSKSSVKYFEALKLERKIAATKVKPCRSGRTQPNQIVKQAIQLKVDAENSESGTTPFQEIWCVIDGDYGATKISTARKEAKKHGIQLAITTQCFEYWLLLHYEKSNKPAEKCDNHVSALKKYLNKYDKGNFDFCEIVKLVHTATKHAKSLRDTNTLPERQNPCSDIYKLIESIDSNSFDL